MTFEDLNPGKAVLNALRDMDYVSPTLIQSRVYPVATSGRSVIGIAQTGTGKTLAYLLSVLRMWSFSKQRHPQILIVVPTRELVVQVTETAKKLTAYMNFVTVGVYGGTNLNVQAAEVDLGADMIVGTPGRLMDLVYHGSLKLKSVKKLIIDEVDEMLDLGFRPQLKILMDMLPVKRQNLMFSATLSEDVEAIIENYFDNPERIEAAPSGTPLEQIQQKLYKVSNYNTKLNLTNILLKDKDMYKVLIFASTKSLADLAFEKINESYPEITGVIHSNKSQNTRLNTVKGFTDGTIRILVATDIMSRGLDITGVSHVISLDVPEEPLNYIHRIGRTGRAGEHGVAISIISPGEEALLADIETMMGIKITVCDLPEGLVISDELCDHEKPVIKMKNILARIPSVDKSNPAFHEKKAKNRKVNQKVRFSEKMKAKYGKPKTRGQKQKGK